MRRPALPGRLGRLIALMLALAALAVLATPFLPADPLARALARQVAAATGLPVTVAHEARLFLWRGPGLQTGAVAVGDPGGAGPQVSAAAVRLRFDAAALMRLRLVPVAVAIEAAEIGAGDDPAAWRALAAQALGAAGGRLRLSLRDGRIRQPDPADELSALTLEAAFDGPGGALAVAAEGRRGGRPLALTLRLSDPRALAAGRLSGIDAAVALGGATVALRGRVGLAPLQAEGRLDAVLVAPPAALAAAGLAAPALPEGLGRDGASLSGEVTLTPAGTLHLRGGRLALDDNRLDIDADLDPAAGDGGVPRLAARLAAARLDLVALGAGGWPFVWPDPAVLNRATADLAFATEALDLGLAEMGPTRLRLTLTGGRLAAEGTAAVMAGGAVGTTLRLEDRAGVLSLDARARAQSVAVAPVLRDLAGHDGLSGRADATVAVTAAGPGWAGLAAALEGRGEIALGGAEWRGTDLAAMLRSPDPAHRGETRRTVLTTARAVLTLARGTVAIADLALAGPGLRASGWGRVDPAAGRVDVTLVPAAPEQPGDSAGIRVPLRIVGPWDDPVFLQDPRALEEERRARAAAVAAARARAEQARRTEERLGLPERPTRGGAQPPGAAAVP